jgi:hypothetical protein
LDAILALPLIAAVHSLSFGARTELRLRAPGDVDAQGEQPDQALDLDNSASARMLTRFKRFDLGIAYLPQLNFRNMTEGGERDLLHGGELSGIFRWRRVTLSLLESASYGTRSFSPLSAPPSGSRPVTTPPREIALSGSVSYVSSETTLTSTLLLTRRSTLNLSTSYFIRGGTNEAARSIFPQTKGIRESVGLDRAVTRQDTLATSLEGTAQSAEGADQTDPVQTQTVALGETWRRRWSRATASDVRVGVGLSSSTESDDNPSFYPNSSATLTHRIAQARRSTVDLAATASVDNVVDPLTGGADTRAVVSGRAGWTLAPFFFYAEASHAESIGATEQDLVLTSGALGARAQLARPFAAEVGFRVVDQSVGDTAPSSSLAVSGLTWAVFAALEYRGEAIEL